jgi:hypothetical protein
VVGVTIDLATVCRRELADRGVHRTLRSADASRAALRGSG